MPRSPKPQAFALLAAALLATAAVAAHAAPAKPATKPREDLRVHEPPRLLARGALLVGEEVLKPHEVRDLGRARHDVLPAARRQGATRPSAASCSACSSMTSRDTSRLSSLNSGLAGSRGRGSVTGTIRFTVPGR